MEEILASIRRIISDGDDADAEGAEKNVVFVRIAHARATDM